MNTEHFRAFVWLRYRLRLNQLRRGGVANVVILGVITAALAMTAVGSAVGGFALGLFGLDHAPAAGVMLAWDAAVGGFLFVWMIGLMADLQRSEAVSIDKVLHLPVSPSGAFAVNYLSSLVSLTLAVFLPGLVGLALGLAGSRGPWMLLALPLLAAFVFAVTAVTYQFQGWLATLMSNPRRRRSVIVLFTGGFILLAQAPQLVNIARPWEQDADPTAQNAELVAATQAENTKLVAVGAANNADLAAAGDAFNAAMAAATADLAAGRLSRDQYPARLDDIGRENKARQDRTVEANKARFAKFESDQAARRDQAERDRQTRRTEALRGKMDRYADLAWVTNAVFPPGWLPLGAGSLIDGDPVPALLGTLGLAALGSLSLWRAYRTTVRLVTGEYTADTGARAAGKSERRAPSSRVPMVEWRLPGVSEPAAAVATAGLRSLIRAPEAKMVIFAPFLFVIVFGTLAASMPGSPHELVRPLMAAGGVGLILLTAIQLVGNQFGFDRGGFRAFVLAPAPRRDVMLGKNLAAAPLILGLAWVTVALVGTVFPMRFDHLLAALLQAAAMYLIFCMLANALSILAPLPVAAGAMQPTGVRFTQVLGQLLTVALMPVAVAPTFAPLAVEALLTEAAGVARGVPVALVLSTLVLAGVVALYRRVLTWEGDLLAAREQDVLLVVTSKEE